MQNFLVYFGAALIPMLVGAVWYHPKVFGNTWMKLVGLTDKKISQANMPLTMGLSFLMSLIITLPMSFFANHPAAPYGGDASYDTFQHGVLHGVLMAILVGLPLIGTKALFELRGWKYVLINLSYWVVAFGLMGGILDYFLPTFGM